ncbi:MAG: sigma-54-dependent Fis family transcriptional regulator [Acidobacteria bacterium]|nr:sigma-54-dependent Fis family transcriptional regulator [Acidobacteriota bacterium]
MANVLVIDDDKILNEFLCNMVAGMGHQSSHAENRQEGLKLAKELLPDIIYLDVHLPDGSGLGILPSLREISSEPEIIIITGTGDPDSAELAIKNGAWDYIVKPASLQDISLPLIRALQYRSAKQNRNPLAVIKREGIVGDSPSMKQCLDSLARAATSDISVLITGETGTGKELFARAIHNNSSRAESGFVIVDCTALPETLVESILFGHQRGAFTGADKTTEGLIKQADGGTLFLDEAGELPLPLQKAFLRVLQEHRVRPLGSGEEYESNFRLISATNRDLDRMVEEGAFRRDLLFRLRAFQLDLPPLREHLQDIKQLAIHHVFKICERYGEITKAISPEFFSALMEYDWPGNIRELVQTIESAIVASDGEPVLFPHHLPVSHRVRLAQSSIGKSDSGSTARQSPSKTQPTFPGHKSFRAEVFASAEKQYLQELLRLSEGDFQRACTLSGLSRARLYALLSKYRISRKQ